MRIWWQSFVDHAQNAPYLARLEEYLNEIADPGTSVKVHGTRPGNRDINRLSEFRCSILAVDNALEAAAQGYDGYVMGHFQDPGLYAARSAVRIPVVGAGESTLHWAAQLGRRIGLVSIDPLFEVWHLEQGDLYGLSGRVEHVTGIGATPETFAAAFAGDQAAFDRLVAVFVKVAEPLVDAGADVLIPAGVLPGLLLSRLRGFKVKHAPVLSCASIPLKCAEVAVKLHRLHDLEPSRGPSFALASQQTIDDFRALVRDGRGG